MRAQIKILVVDDDARDRRAVRQALDQHYQGAIVQEAATCSEATRALLSCPFDCVILDDTLPDGNGLSCLTEVREAGITTPVVLLTASGDEHVAVETITAGAPIALPKRELTPALLDHCLRSALRFHQSQEQVRQTQEALRCVTGPSPPPPTASSSATPTSPTAPSSTVTPRSRPSRATRPTK